MSSIRVTRKHLWLESLGDWSWPGQASDAAEAVEAMPPSWVPAFPSRPAPIPAVATAAGSWPAPRRLPRAWGAGTLLSGLAAICALLLLSGPRAIEQAIGMDVPGQPVPRAVIRAREPAPVALPRLVPVSSDASGSSIEKASYHSPAIHGRGAFLIYLPPGYAGAARSYPVLYLLPGNDQPASAFLHIGLQETLDRLITSRRIPPLIAVMIQGGLGANNWRNQGSRGYESYVLEVQRLTDEMLPTLPDRGARAIAGDSMGGYGAMNIALGNPARFSVVESWLGFFNGLEGELHAARGIISRDGLQAFVYGGESDHIANPAEDAPFAAGLRAAGASAHSAIYPGGHSLETVQENLAHMLTFAGRALAGEESAHR